MNKLFVIGESSSDPSEWVKPYRLIIALNEKAARSLGNALTTEAVTEVSFENQADLGEVVHPSDVRDPYEADDYLGFEKDLD